MTDLTNFKKKKNYLVCIDSDGCAMDTMDIKHIRCFGPCMVKQWELYEWKEEILTRWNEVNLYTITRGINRFKGLAVALTEINQKYKSIKDVEKFIKWVEEAKELSNNAVSKKILENPNIEIFKKALAWSEDVNKSITNLPEEEIKPFEMVKDALKFAHERADIAIVSSANIGAVLDEWTKHGLLEHVDIVLAQNAGSKAFCISELLKKGYENKNVLMCGDALGDMQAAEKNEVNYYPILVKKEKESWDEFIKVGFDKLLSDCYQDEYQQIKKQEFLKNLVE